MQIIRIWENKKDYLPLLLLGDEQEEMIDRYLDRSDLYALIRDDGEALAVIAVTDEGGRTLEIKNLAVREQDQGRGYGRKMMDYVAHVYQGRFDQMLVGTGDSPLTVPFYERCGFVRCGVIPDFFVKNYDHPIIEAGVQLRDMVYFRRAL